VGSDNEVCCWGKSNSFGTVVNAVSPTPAIYSEPKKLQRGYLAAGASVTEIHSGNNTDCGIDSAGKAFCYLTSTAGKVPTLLAPGPVLSNVKLIAMSGNDLGDFYSALGDDGWAYTIGRRYGYQYGDASSVTNLSASLITARIAQGDIATTERLVSIATGGAIGSTCAVADSGSAYCWGQGTGGSLGNGELRIRLKISTYLKKLFGEKFLQT
jgi:alpha-tubulin suppressor-like RCC1 family protein